ncbi:unnamed protein product [Merluccius merluccius]
MATTPSGEIPSVPQPQPIPGFRAPGSQGPRGQPYFAYNRPDVSITCSTSDFVVRVKTAFYGLGANAEELRLGSTCRSNGVLGPYGDLLFAFRITECDVQRETDPVGSQFVSQDNQTLRFSLSAFQFTSDPNTQVGSSVLS